MTTIAVMIFVMLAMSMRSSAFFSKITSPVSAHMTIALCALSSCSSSARTDIGSIADMTAAAITTETIFFMKISTTFPGSAYY